MSNLPVHKTASTPAPRQLTSWDPFARMRELLQWDPIGEFRLAPMESGLSFVPAFEVKETENGYEFKADLPGIKEEDVEIHLTGDRLTISGKREAEKKSERDTYYAYERSYGSFMRSFTLPTGADAENARAEMKDGVLTLLVPKTPEVQPKRIAVQSSGKAKA